MSYAGQRIALLTQHDKGGAIAPVLAPALGCSVETVGGFDTDRLGSFTREIARVGTQREAARQKARIGMALSGLPIGMGSEGSFGPDPVAGLFPWNVEVLVLVDDRLGIEIAGVAQGPARHAHLLTASWEALRAFAEREAFPDHRLVLRPGHMDDPRVHKGIGDWATLEARFHECSVLAADGQVFVESDLRAFANPTRMRMIGQAAQDLLHRLQSPCPRCASPGFWVGDRHAGLPCEICGSPTPVIARETWRCPRCAHEEDRPAPGPRAADPRHCPDCNP